MIAFFILLYIPVAKLYDRKYMAKIQIKFDTTKFLEIIILLFLKFIFTYLLTLLYKLSYIAS